MKQKNKVEYFVKMKRKKSRVFYKKLQLLIATLFIVLLVIFLFIGLLLVSYSASCTLLLGVICFIFPKGYIYYLFKTIFVTLKNTVYFIVIKCRLLTSRLIHIIYQNYLVTSRFKALVQASSLIALIFFVGVGYSSLYNFENGYKYLSSLELKKGIVKTNIELEIKLAEISSIKSSLYSKFSDDNPSVWDSDDSLPEDNSLKTIKFIAVSKELKKLKKEGYEFLSISLKEVDSPDLPEQERSARLLNIYNEQQKLWYATLIEEVFNKEFAVKSDEDKISIQALIPKISVNFGLNSPSNVLNKYQLKIEPTNNTLGQFQLNEKLDLNKSNLISFLKASKENIKLHVLPGTGGQLEELSSKPLKETLIDKIMLNYIFLENISTYQASKLIKSIGRGLILKEIYFSPLNLDSNNYIDFPIARLGCRLKMRFCCPNLTVKLVDFPKGAFYEARGAKSLQVSPYLDTETIDWSVSDIEKGIKLAYIQPPFHLFMRLKPLISFFNENKWLITILTIFITFIYYIAVLKPLKALINIEARAEAMSESIDQSRKIEISGGTVNASGAGALSLGDISGTVANAINQLPAASESKNPGIKELLEQLKAGIEAEPNLSDKDKVRALKQLEVIAEAGKAPEKGAVQEAVDNAITMLKGIISGLPAVAKLAEAGKTLLPMIAGLFGIA